jgi:hypothetical protein
MKQAGMTREVRYPNMLRLGQDLMLSQGIFEHLRYELGYTRDIPTVLPH